MKLTAFSLLHPTIQQKLYQMEWTEIRPVQADAIHAIFESEDHLVISASTAAGKTEAAFLPVLSKIIENQSKGIGAIYVGPLKALINDQFQRLEQLCNLSDIPVFKWHGDVSSDKKHKYLKNPHGVLLITPESIESIFINHSDYLSILFSELSFIVVDEMHSFIGTERGEHLKSLLSRINSFPVHQVRIIGLSATFGDTSLVKEWLMPRNPDSVHILDDPGRERGIKYLIKGYYLQKNGDGEESDNGETPDKFQLVIDDVIKYFYRHSSLIFVNSRERLEIITDYVRRRLEQKGLPDFFMIHHGSLSKSEREDAECELKTNSRISCFSSSSLEMGIDVGNLSRIGQIGAPWSVNSLVQRLGRSGRGEGESSEMILFIIEEESDNIIRRLFPELIRAIAMSELMKEKWYEPPQINYPHYSTFVQQILSVIKQTGGVSILQLFEDLVRKGSFISLQKPEYISILQKMKEADLIEQTPGGLLILGLTGEEVVRSVDFYAVFQSPIDMQVISKGRKIGSIAKSPGLENRKYLILAGRRWEIINIDYKKKEILVEPSKGAKPPKFYDLYYRTFIPKSVKKCGTFYFQLTISHTWINKPEKW
jgi:ATP-dependent helicase Lhr and Lhr-like helicase